MASFLDILKSQRLETYVINLDSNPQKWEITNQRLSSLTWGNGSWETTGLKPKRWSAVDGMKVRECRWSINPNMTKGGIGCALSHLEILREIQNSQREWTMVFEDDAVPSEKFFDIALRNGLPEGVDVIWMGSDLASKGTGSCFCTHAMIYNRSFPAKVFDYLDKHGLESIDIVYKCMQMKGLINFRIWDGEPTENDLKKSNLYLARSYGAVYQDLTMSTDIWKYKVENKYGYSPFDGNSFYNLVNNPKLCRTVVISLDRCRDRYNHFMLGAQDAGFHYVERFAGIDKISPDFDRSNIPYKKDGRHNGRLPAPRPDWTNYEDMSDGQVACALSHLALMEQCIKDNKVYVVFEDDAWFVPEFQEVAEQYWRATSITQRELIMIGHDIEDAGSVDRRPTWNTHAYMYTPRFCKAFISFLNHGPGLFCIDISIREFQEHYKDYSVWLRKPTEQEKANAHANRCGGLVHQAIKFGTLL